MKKYIEMFGFYSWNDFWQSLLRIDLYPLFTVCAMVGVFLERILGVGYIALVALALLFIIELLTGILKSVRTREKRDGWIIKSILLHRWGFKVFIWLSFIFITHSFYDFFRDSWEGYVFIILHHFVIFYVLCIYLLSVSENMAELGYTEFNKINEFIKSFSLLKTNNKRKHENRKKGCDTSLEEGK